MLNLKQMLSGEIRKASHVIRYSSIEHGRDQNIAEHSHYVTLYALMIGRDCLQAGMKLKMEKLLIDAIMHDVDEVVTGDFIRSFKYSNDEMHAMMDDMASYGCKELLQQLGVPELHKNWEHAKDTKTIEGQIVLIADLLEVVAYCITRIKVGNQHMKTVLRGAYEKFITKMDGAVYDRYKTAIAEVVMQYVGDAPEQPMPLMDYKKELKEKSSE